MKIAICDDETIFRKQIKKYISDYYDNKLDLYIDEFSSGEELIDSYKFGANYNIVILDIEMKNINGIETAKRIREYTGNEIIVFLTSHREYAVDGYEVSAFRFLEKPVSEEKLILTLNQIDKLVLNKKTIVLHTSEEDIRAYLKDIVFIEAIRNYIYIHIKVQSNAGYEIKEYKMRKALSDFLGELEELECTCFFQCHRSYIINLDYVSSYDSKQVVLEKNINAPLSRSKQKELKERIILRIEEGSIN